MSKTSEVLFSPLFKDNPIALQVLGICSALAVTSKLYPTLITVSYTHLTLPTKRIV